MDIQVLVEPVDGKGYRASALSLSAEGATEEEAIAQLNGLLLQRLAAGAKVVTVPMPTLPSWMKHRSKRPLDDPLIQEYLESVAEIRRKADEEENPI
jgi:hypothetical protein